MFNDRIGQLQGVLDQAVHRKAELAADPDIIALSAITQDLQHASR